MTDFEERAREILITLCNWDLTDSTVEIVAAALRAAHNEALEKAAKVADDWGWSSKAEDAHEIRDAIRALKEE